MTDIAIPHFDLPFRYLGPVPVVVEQDTLEDVTNCVEAIFRTNLGDRPELPSFGLEDMTFDIQPIQTAGVMQSVAAQEPRSIIAIDQEPDIVDHLIAKMQVNVSQVEVS